MAISESYLPNGFYCHFKLEQLLLLLMGAAAVTNQRRTITNRGRFITNRCITASTQSKSSFHS